MFNQAGWACARVSFARCRVTGVTEESGGFGARVAVARGEATLASLRSLVAPCADPMPPALFHSLHSLHSLDSPTRAQSGARGRKAPRRTPFAAGAALALFALGYAAFGCAAKLAPVGGVESEAIPCVNAFDCPRAPNPCVISTCVERYCAMASASEKTVASEQKEGDCALIVCDGRGGVSLIHI